MGNVFIGEYDKFIYYLFLISLIFLGGFNPLWIIPGAVAIVLKVMLLIFIFYGQEQLGHI